MPLSALSPKSNPLIPTTMKEYICYPKQGHWTFYADNDIDAMRLALFYCWRDGEDFDRVELGKYSHTYTLRICQIDERNSIQTL